MPRLKSWLLASASALTVALSIVGATACGGPRSSEDASVSTSASLAAASPDSASLPIIRQVPKRLRAEVALFRSPPEGLPIGVTLALSGVSTHGANWRLAQALPGTPWPAWLIPGRGFVCLMQQKTSRSGIGQACAAERKVLANGIFSTTLAANPQLQAATRVVIGVVPDRTRAVRVHTPYVPTARVTVRQGVFTLSDDTSAPPESITLASVGTSQEDHTTKR